MAAKDVEGIDSLGGFGSEVAETLGRKNLARGVKVEADEKEASIDLKVTVRYGLPIQEIAWNLQLKIIRTVESMTGVRVIAVNVQVLGIKG